VTDELLLQTIREHEGFRAGMYRCPAGYNTIGYGFNLDVGMSRAEAEALLRARLETVEKGLRLYPWFAPLAVRRQRALLEMGYQLGLAGLAGFTRMLSALAVDDYELAAEEMLDSKWAEQTPVRALHCATLMREG